MNKWSIINDTQDNNGAIKKENLNHLEVGNDNYNWHLTKFSLFNESAIKTADRKQSTHWFRSMSKDLLVSFPESVPTEIKR